MPLWGKRWSQTERKTVPSSRAKSSSSPAQPPSRASGMKRASMPYFDAMWQRVALRPFLREMSYHRYGGAAP